MRRGLLLTVLLVLGAPHSAFAGTVSFGEISADSKYGYTSRALFFSAAPGERNRIVVTAAGDFFTPRFVLHDAGASVTSASGCTTIDERTVDCPASSVFVDAGDGDDEVTLPSADRDGYVRGGDGSDVLTGGGFLTGGPGNDVLACPGACTGSVLAGGAGDDILRGGSGNDILSGDGDGPAYPIGYKKVLSEAGTTGNDVIDGGPGTDQLTFRGRVTGVTVDLAAGAATSTGGERDSLAGIENVAGSAGDDLLLGDAGANLLEGGSGSDRISGRGGDDYLLGNLVPDTNGFSDRFIQRVDPGADTLRGGEGDDTLDAGSERGDVLSGGPGADTLQDGDGGPTHVGKVRCGSGRDTIEFAPQGQLLSDCELLIGGGARVALRPRLRAGGRLGFVWRCYRGGRCGVAAAVRVRSSRPMNRTVVFRGRRELVFRPRRPARRGDVVDITAVVSTGDPPLYAARWRVEL